MNINIRKASHIEIAHSPGGGYQVQFISSNGRRMGRPGVATTRHEAEVIDDCRGMARYYLYLAKGASL